MPCRTPTAWISTFWESIVTESAGVHVLLSPGLAHVGVMDPAGVSKAIKVQIAFSFAELT
jgi:hypothetical protein